MTHLIQLPPALVERYRLVRELGEGGMGKVFEGLQTELNRRVALKILRPEYLSDLVFRERFASEARILSRLSHPNIVHLFDADVEGDFPYLAMEFVEGPSLEAQLRKQGRFSPLETFELAAPMLDGLRYLHESGIVHRDLKPDNILLQDGRVPKLADFGLARVQGSRRITESGYVVGTLAFMAPEILTGKDASVASDVYAFGMILYYMLTGTFPFGDDDEGSATGSVLQGVSSALVATRLCGAPAGVSEVVTRCLATAARDRFPSADTLQRDLVAAIGTGRGRASSSHKAAGGKTAATPARAAAAAGMASSPRRVVAQTWKSALLVGFVASMAAGASFVVWDTMRSGEGASRPSQTPSDSEPGEAGHVAMDPRQASALASSHTGSGFTTSPGAPVLAPELGAVDVGCDRARLSFHEPALPGLKFTFWKLRDKGASASLPVSPGVTSLVLSGLAPGTDYEGGFPATPPSERCSFRTLRRASSGGASILDVTSSREYALAAAAEGDSVAVVWCRAGKDAPETLFVSESTDGGSTWSEPEALFTGRLASDALSVGWTREGLLVAWHGPGSRASLRFRPRRQRSFSPPTAVPGFSPGPSLATGPNGEVALLHRPAGGSGTSFNWTPVVSGRLDEGRSRPICRLPVFDFNWGTAFSMECGLAALLLPSPTSRTSYALHAIRCEGSERAVWSEPRPLSPPLDIKACPDAAATSSALAVAYRVDPLVHLAVSRDCGRSFTTSTPARQDGDDTRTLPALAAAGNQLYLAWVRQGNTATFAWIRLEVFRSTDGLTWTPHAQIPMSFVFPSRLRLIACERRLLLVMRDRNQGLMVVGVPR